MGELDDLKSAMDTLKTEMPKNVDLLNQIAAKARAQVGNWKTPLPGQKRPKSPKKKPYIGSKPYSRPYVTQPDRPVTDRQKAIRAQKRKAWEAKGWRKVNGQWVKSSSTPSTGGTEAPS